MWHYSFCIEKKRPPNLIQICVIIVVSAGSGVRRPDGGRPAAVLHLQQLLHRRLWQARHRGRGCGDQHVPYTLPCPGTGQTFRLVSSHFQSFLLAMMNKGKDFWKSVFRGNFESIEFFYWKRRAKNMKFFIWMLRLVARRRRCCWTPAPPTAATASICPRLLGGGRSWCEDWIPSV